MRYRGEMKMRNIWHMIGIAMFVTIMSISCVGCGSATAANEASEVEETEETTEISVFGKAEAIDAEEIYIDFPARVVDVLVEEGQEINKGDKLMTLDYEEYKNSIAAEAVQKQLNMVNTQDNVQTVSAINTQISALEKEKSLKQSYLQNSNYQIQTLQNSVDVLDEKLKKANEDYESEKTLLEAGASTEEKVKELKLSMESIQDEKKNIQKQIQAFKDNTKIEIDQLEANIKGKRDEMTQKQNTNNRAANKESLSAQVSDINIKNMNAKLSKTYLNGNHIVSDLKHAIVEEIACEKGTYVGNQGPTYCMKLLDEDSIQVVADVPEEFIGQISIGQQCKVVPYYDNTLSLAGKVVRMDQRAVKKDGEVIVKVYIELADQSTKVMPGLSVDVIF